MNASLISALIEKHAFVSDTIITANYSMIDLHGRQFSKTGEFRLQRIMKSKGIPVFELKNIAGGPAKIIVMPEEICAIDGMDLMRYADIYDLHPDGSSKKVGRKRGRKPKHVLNT
jgi:hypothetical protein